MRSGDAVSRFENLALREHVEVDMDGHTGVLIADPDDSARVALARILRAAGHHVIQAESGDEALALARSTAPAAVILEVPLLGLSGYEVCHALKSDPGGDVPVIFLSGARTESYDRVAGLLLGADDYLTKPYTAGELLARLTNLIRRSRARTVGVTRRLTKRELEVLELLGDGHRHDAIARRLFISPKTVATHVEHILRKLDARSRAEAIAIAYREEILQVRMPVMPREAPAGEDRGR
jgi:DNA-binding NarL/FixJ family response regulator